MIGHIFDPLASNIAEASAATERLLAQFGPRSLDYARRLSRETVHDFGSAADHAKAMLLAGADDHQRATRRAVRASRRR